jgi:hypothetical protein
MSLPARVALTGGSVRIETARGVKEITLLNNFVRF